MKVLIADDEDVSRKLLQSSLTRWGYQTLVAADGEEALELLRAPDPPKLAILDWLMPGIDGVELCRKIRKETTEPYTYIILLTGKRTKSDVIEGLDAGADDYVIKPFDADELKVRLRTGKRILYLQEQLITAREALREQATHDALTGLWNRAATLELLSNELSRQKRHGGGLAVAMVDLDRFKEINDVHGHLVGDAVLRATAETMRGSTRPYDSVGRFGGEEFLIVLPGCDQTNAMSHAERMRMAISRAAVQAGGQTVQVTASIGVTVAPHDANADAIQLIRAADAALYTAKDHGRNCVEFAECHTLPVGALHPATECHVA